MIAQTDYSQIYSESENQSTMLNVALNYERLSAATLARRRGRLGAAG
jgi:hypothetical protein